MDSYKLGRAPFKDRPRNACYFWTLCVQYAENANYIYLILIMLS